MFKNLIILIFIFVGIDNIYCKTLDSFYLKGFYFVSYSKNEFKTKSKSRDIKNGAPVFQILIDENPEEYFIDIEDFKKNGLSFFIKNDRDILIKSNQTWVDLLKDYCNKFEGSALDSQIVFKSSKYYSCIKRNEKFKGKYLQFFYIEGWFSFLKVDSCIEDNIAKRRQKKIIKNKDRILLIPIRILSYDFNPENNKEYFVRKYLRPLD